MKDIYKYFPEEYNDLYENGFFSSIDINLAEYYYEKSSEKNILIYLAIMLTSRSLSRGSICCDFSICNSGDDIEKVINQYIPDISELEKIFIRSGITGKAGEYLPFIYENNKLYFQKYFQYETIIADHLKFLSGRNPVINSELLRINADQLFSNSESGTDLQKVAAVNSCINSISFISGGPGTGKTTTVVKILLLLMSQLIDKKIEPRIALTAPTGKAAAHLHNSVKSAIETINQFYPSAEEYKKYIPEKSFTLHRLLGTQENSSTFRHNNDNKLPYNIIIIDETSMTDIALMYKFIIALPDNCQVIFLGDKDQLASVQAGSVLGDICAFPAEHISEKIIASYNKIMHENSDFPFSNDCGSIHKNIIFLTKSHRFSEFSGIGKYATLIRDRKTDEIKELIKTDSEKNIRFIPVKLKSNVLEYDTENNKILDEFVFTEKILNGYMEYIKSKSIKEAFINFKKFKILCAVKKGFYGTETINKNIEKLLYEKNLLNTKKQFYHLKPVIIMNNDYTLNLFNGDTGITFHDEFSDTFKVYFEDSNDGNIQYRTFNPLQLKNYETVYAMTIHKSQGSEFEDVLMIIPPDDNPGLTSELIYTGLTRAKNRVVIVANEEIFLKACSRKMKRMSGLNNKIYF